VELEDVPDSVAELIEGELYRLENAKQIVGKALEGLGHEEPHLDLVAKSLDKTRQLLAAIDVRLNECESILAGYERAINPPPQPQMAAAPPTSYAPPSIPKTSPSGKTDPETKVYNYEAPYVRHNELADDQQFDGEPE
jgi:hypothetical protein